MVAAAMGFVEVAMKEEAVQAAEGADSAAIEGGSAEAAMPVGGSEI